MKKSLAQFYEEMLDCLPPEEREEEVLLLIEELEQHFGEEPAEEDAMLRQIKKRANRIRRGKGYSEIQEQPAPELYEDTVQAFYEQDDWEEKDLNEPAEQSSMSERRTISKQFLLIIVAIVGIIVIAAVVAVLKLRPGKSADVPAVTGETAQAESVKPVQSEAVSEQTGLQEDAGAGDAGNEQTTEDSAEMTNVALPEGIETISSFRIEAIDGTLLVRQGDHVELSVKDEKEVLYKDIYNGEWILKTEKTDAVLTVPAGVQKVLLDGSRSIKVESLSADEVELKISGGNIQADNVSARELEVDCSNGTAELTAVNVSEKISVEALNATVQLAVPAVENPYSYDVEINGGSVQIGDRPFTQEEEAKFPGSLEFEIDCEESQINVSFQ